MAIVRILIVSFLFVVMAKAEEGEIRELMPSPVLNAWYDENTHPALPKEFWYEAFYLYTSSTSNLTHTLILIDKYGGKSYKVEDILNRYQAHHRKGSEAEPEGIYTDKEGNYYIDYLTTENTPTASCNACQTYNVVTLKITPDGLTMVSERKFDIEHYAPYAPKKNKGSKQTQ